MSDDIVVVDNGSTYETQESSIVAKNEADRAEQWAQESERQANIATSNADTAINAKDEAVAAKQYAETAITDENLIVVATDLKSTPSNIKKTARSIDNVNTVSNDIENINAVAANKANIDNVAANKTNINNVAANIAAVNNVSENMTDVKNAVQSANDAKLWAVGTKTEKPEGSSKYWAEQAKNAVQTPDASETVKGIVRLATSDEVTAGTNDSAAITPLKLKQKLDTKQDKSTAVNYTNITNCITEIPQDIKLELNNGTLTLKAGSKVYVPNGFESDGTTPKFDAVTINTDLSIPKWGNSAPGLISITSNRELWIALLEQQYSGISAPTSQLALWYDTTNNIIKSSSNAGSSWKEGYCLPIAICTSDSSKWTSIDQVFNGFGYIGSTVFALPDVKGLIPNGRNENGSLKNIKVEFTNVITKTFPSNLSLDVVFGSGKSDIVANGKYKYDEQNNYNYDGSTIWPRCYFAIGHLTNGKITSFTPKTAFHAVDYNDSSTISGWSMPSGRFIDLTLGASGTSYTAPANGFFFVKKVTRAVSQFLLFNTANMEQESLAVNAGNWVGGFVPVKKGMNCTIHYSASGEVNFFRFIYAEGE